MIVNRRGAVTWSFGAASGPDRLAKPSLAVRWPNGLIAANDDYNHRVIVIDPRTKRIVWQYGHTGVAGRAAGYLDKPDGIDLLPATDLVPASVRRQFSTRCACGASVRCRSLCHAWPPLRSRTGGCSRPAASSAGRPRTRCSSGTRRGFVRSRVFRSRPTTRRQCSWIERVHLRRRPDRLERRRRPR